MGDKIAGYAEAAMLQIKQLDHLVLRVVNLQAMMHFYMDVLGCSLEKVQEKIGLWQLRAGSALIDLVPASTSPSEAADKTGRNMDHFCVRLAGFDAAALKAHLAKNGVDPGDVHERYGAEGYGPSIYLSDPDGNTVELKGPATRGL